MPHSALSVSNEILKRAREEGIEISNMKLQKLLYIANGLHLAKSGTPLIEEPVEVWPYGPVVNNVYHEFKAYGNQNIPKQSKILAPGTTRPFNDDAEESISFALDVAKKLTAVQLSNWTHAEDSPWTAAQQKNEKMIPEQSMKDFFEQFYTPKE